MITKRKNNIVPVSKASVGGGVIGLDNIRLNKSFPLDTRIIEQIQIIARSMFVMTNNYIDIPNDQILTADADGYAFIYSQRVHTAGQAGFILYSSVNNEDRVSYQATAQQGVTMSAMGFVPKGHKYCVWCNGGNIIYNRFYYTESNFLEKIMEQL